MVEATHDFDILGKVVKVIKVIKVINVIKERRVSKKKNKIKRRGIFGSRFEAYCAKSKYRGLVKATVGLVIIIHAKEMRLNPFQLS